MSDQGECQSYMHELVIEGRLQDYPALNALIEFVSVRC